MRRPAELVAVTFALQLYIASLCRAFLPLYLGPLWASEIARRTPTNMGFDPPGPQSNPPIRDFLWEQEVVQGS